MTTILKGWTEVKLCPVCGSNCAVPYKSAMGKPYNGISMGFADIITATVVEYVQCLVCGMVWQNPCMTEEAISNFYSSGAYRKIGQPDEVVDLDEKNRAERIFNTIEHIKFGSHLDIGCSRGYLLKITQKLLGCAVTGVDFDTQRATGIKVYPHVREVPFPHELITMIHVLEHVTKPVEFVTEAANHLTDGGTMIIEVPSNKSLGGPLRLAHPIFMEPWTLVTICERAKLDIVNVMQEEHTLVIASKED